MDIYKDIECRTNGELYIGVVGPVRTGKSTFIKRFMELLVLPTIKDEYSKELALDELPQSAGGKTVMTTEPKFIPKEAAEVLLPDGVEFKVRMIDCVGYMVDGVLGHEEDGKERLVKTPWYDYDIPFTKAASIGTKKVIYDHSTLGIVITSDGTITDIERDAYIEPEMQTIEELKSIGKPFVVLLNSKKPASYETLELAHEMEELYKASVIPVNCDQLKMTDVTTIFEKLLLDFPITAVNFTIPKWIEAMDNKSTIKQSIILSAKAIFDDFEHMKDVSNDIQIENEYIENIDINTISLADGSININMKLFDKFYYDMISDMLGCNVNNEYDFIKEIKNMADTKKQCEKVSIALLRAFKTGYGSVTPEQGEIKLDEPELIKSGNKYGVKIKACAPSIHLIKANITTEIAPIVGTEEQARDLIKYIGSDGISEDSIWGVNIFGKTIKQLVEDGLKAKINKINQESQQKLQDTMEKIVNDSNGGMVCIII